MANIENVVWSLERCASSVPDACKDCKYDNFPPRICVAHLAKDALTLLKAQQPRVLTLDEVKASNGKDLILEYGQWGCEDNVVTAATIEGCGRKGVSFALSVVCDYATYNRKHSFGWRCWTSRPTDEQRKAVKWND